MRRSLSLFVALAAGLAWIYGAQALDTGRLRAAFFRVAANAPEERFSAWIDLVAKNRPQPGNARLDNVNNFVNRRIRFADDQEIWGQSDYWATPMETLAKAAGDCEDFAILKYYTLLMTGIPVEQLRLTYVRARIGGTASSIFQAHMVLAYYPSPDAEPLVLDNLVGTIYPASQRPDLQPVFSFNSQYIFQAPASGAAPATAVTTSTSRLSRWQELLQRARNEGFDQ